MAWHVAVIGSGGWSRVHLRTLQASDHVSAVTLVGRNESSLLKLADEFSIVRQTASDLSAVLDNDEILLVDIVLPHHLHAQTAIAALAAGKHVICEKPAAMTLDEFDRVAATANSHDRRWLVVMNQLYNPIHQTARRLIDEGAIGRPFLAVELGFSHHTHFYEDPKTWRTRWATAGGGVLIDGGYHMIYKHLLWLGGQGEPRWVMADAAQLAVDESGKTVESQGEDFVQYTVGYDGPLRVASAHAWTLAADPLVPRQNFVAGTLGTLQITDNEKAPLQVARAEGIELVSVPAGPTSNPDTLSVCLQDYVESLVEERPVCHGSQALARRALEVIQAVYESARRGRRVELT